MTKSRPRVVAAGGQPAGRGRARVRATADGVGTTHAPGIDDAFFRHIVSGCATACWRSPATAGWR